MDGCTFSGYEACDKGRYRSIDRKQGNRQLKGKVLATRRTDDGYVLVNIRCDSTDPDHNRVHTVTGHKIVLTRSQAVPARHGSVPHAPRARRSTGGPEGVRWGTKPENHADMVAAGTAVVPESFPCRNHARCGGTAKTQGRRCLDCVAEVGRDAARLLTRAWAWPRWPSGSGTRVATGCSSWPPSTATRAPKRRPRPSARASHSA